MAEYTRKQTLNWLCYFLFCYDYFVVTVAQLHNWAVDTLTES